ncbi:isoprenoid synthase domain-containing protein [Boletus edulis]|nr:isoprenoid synthase domain-containing protein [Boletus edulis]
MLDSQSIQTISTIVRLLLKEQNISYRVPPFDDKLFQESIDEAVRRGYPMSDDHSLRRYLQDGVNYVATTARHYTHRPTQVWMVLYTAAAFYVDDVPFRFPSEIPKLYLFNDRFVKRQEQENVVLDSLADIICGAPDFFRPILSNLITTSTLDFVTSTLVDLETASMQISSAARQYPTYQRSLSGGAEAFVFMAFPPEVPLTMYIQALPEALQFINELNDVLSFYKEELAGENRNQISIMAARNKESKLEILRRVVDSILDLYKTIMEVLEGSPEASDAFRQFTVGFYHFHFAVQRYKLEDLDL